MRAEAKQPGGKACRLFNRILGLLLCAVMVAGVILPPLSVRAENEPVIRCVTVKEGADGTPVQYDAVWSESSHVYIIGCPVMWIGTYYEIQLFADNSPTSWKFAGYGFPQGMTYDTSTGLISGTPESSSSGYCRITPVNAAGDSVDDLWLTMIFTGEDQRTKIITPDILPQAAVNKNYSAILDSEGYYFPGETRWSLYSGSLPDGLAVRQSGFNDGEIYGTPTQKGTYNFTIQVSNAAGTDTREFTLVVGDNSGITLSVKQKYKFPDQLVGYVDDGCAKSITVSNSTGADLENITITLGGTGASSFSVAPASIPALAAGQSTTFSVVPAAGITAGAHLARVTVSSGDYTQCADVYVKAENMPEDGSPVIRSDGIVEGYIRGALVDEPYSFQFKAAGEGITWSLGQWSNDLPNGLALDSDTGIISGTPTNVTADVYIDIVATADNGKTDSVSVNIRVYKKPTISAKDNYAEISYDSEFPDGFVGQNYGKYVYISCGNDAYLTLAADSLPSFSDTFNADRSWGYVARNSDVPTAEDVGTHTFTISAILKDNCGNELTTVSKTYTMTIYNALTVSGSGEIDPRLGKAITPLDLSALVSGGKGSYSFELEEGKTLPTGLALNSSTGVISGTPTVINEDYNGYIKVSDTAGNTRNISLYIRPVRKAIAVPVAATGLYYTATVQTGVAEGEGYTVSGGTGTYCTDYIAYAYLKSGYIWDDETTSSKDISWSIQKRTVTVTPDALSKDYGSDDPEILTYTTDLATEELRNDFATVAGGWLKRKSGEDAGSYLIEKNNFTAGMNYEITFDPTPVYFTIKKVTDPAVVNTTAVVMRGSTISLADNVSGAMGEVSYEISTALAGCSVDEEGVFTAGSTAGTCVVDVKIAESTNHTGKTVSVSVTVTDKDMTDLTVAQAGTTYGTELADPVYEGDAGMIGTAVVNYSGTLRRDGSHYVDTVKPEEAGSYNVSVVYETADKIYSGKADFTIEPASINDLVVTLGAALTYDGSMKTQNVSSVLFNDVNILSSCDVTGNTALNAGDHTLTITAKNASNFTGSIEKVFNIAKATPVAGDFTVSSVNTKTYDGTAFVFTTPTSSKSGMGTSVTLKYAGSSEAPVNAGSYALTIDVTEGTNYKAVNGLSVGTLTISKAAWSKKALTMDIISGGSDTAELSDYIAPGGAFGVPVITDTEGILNGDPEITALEGDKKGLSVSLINDSTKDGDTATVVIPVNNASNHTDYSITATIKLMGKEVQNAFRFQSGTVNKTYGDDDFNMAVTGAAEGSVVTYTSSDPAVATIGADGKIHILKAGTTNIKASASETATYLQAEGGFVLNVRQATVTVKAADLTVFVGENAPDISSPVCGTHYTVSGLVGTDTLRTAPTLEYRRGSETVTPDTSAARKYDIVASGAEVPNTNYESTISYQRGSLTISEKTTDPVTPEPVDPTPVTPADPVVTVSEHAINVMTGAVARNNKGETVRSAKENDVVNISWTEKQGYEFVKWQLTGATPESVVSANTAFRMGNVDVTVAFEEKLKAADEVREELPENADTTTKVSSLKFEDNRLTLVKGGASVFNPAVAKMASGTAPEIIYVTENKDIVAVDKSGNFYPAGSGEAVVTAYCGNKKATCRVEVVSYTKDIIIRNINDEEVKDGILKMKGGEQALLKVSFEPYDSTDPRTVSWKSDNKSVTVRNGIVTAKEVKSEITATITASVKATDHETGRQTKTVERSVKIVVTPVSVEKAAKDDKSHLLKVGKSLKMVTTDGKNTTDLTVELTPKGKTALTDIKIVSIESSNAHVVEVEKYSDITADKKKGVVTVNLAAKGAGTAYIVVKSTSGDGSAVNVQRCKVNVSSPLSDMTIKGGTLKVNDKKMQLRKGQNGTIAVSLVPALCTDIGKYRIKGKGGVVVKNGIIYAKKVTKDNKPAKIMISCGKVKETIEVRITK